MKDGWKMTSLGEIADVSAGNSAPQDKSLFENGTHPFIRTSDVGQIRFGSISQSADYLNNRGVKKLRRFEKGTILFPKSGASTFLNHRVIMEVDGYVASHLATIRANETVADPRFLLYYLNTVKAQDLIQDHKYPSLNLPVIESIAVPLPPLADQRRIVGILDEAFAGIATAKANAEQNLQNARALFESHLNAVFTQRGPGWVEKPLGEICDLQNGYAFKSGDYIKSSNTLNIRMSSIRPGGTFDAEHNQRFLPDSYANEHSAFLLNDGDLIIAMTDMAGDPKILGVPTLVANQNGRNFLMNQRVGKLFGFADDVRVRYLRYFLTCPAIKQFYKGKGAGGLQINISKKDVLSALIPLPSIATQDRVVDQLDDLSAESRQLESIYQRKLAALDELKKSLLHQAFNGEL